MTEHFSPSVLNALVDGELSADQLANANQHLAGCPSCTADALYQSLLKSATAKAGMRYKPPQRLQERLSRPASGFLTPGWVAAAVILLVSASLILVQHNSAGNSALVAEVFDAHLATIAGNLPPQVLSSDRHTVKPWFQGKLPFSFNLPENLPRDTTLDGANLTYLRGQPVAQLLYSIGKHRISVFVQQRHGTGSGHELTTAHSGFQVIDFDANGLEVAAVSDVDPARLAELVSAIRGAQ
jgi:anti-sigma factor RsiW